MSGESEVAQRQDTLNRYLLYFPRSKNVISDVHSFTGKEILSEPYRYTIRFTSPDLNIAINAVLNQRAEFILRAPNLEASWHGQTSWLPVRQINGTITQFSRLMSSGDEALYECVLEHELALLDQNYRSAVYMNMTVPELVTKLMKDSGHFDGYNIDFDQLSHSYPRREMIVQWKETDLRFIRRLLAEIGIWFRFENHNKVKTETVVIFGDSARRYNFSDKQIPYVRHSGMTSYSEYITDLEEQHGLIPKNVLVRTYNYRDPQSPQTDKTVKTSDIPEGVTTGQHYHYADHYLTAGDFHGEEAETAAFYARLRYERLLNGQSLLGATTSDPELQPGIMFYPSGPVPDGFKSGFVITAMTIRGSRAEHYRAVLSGIPYSQWMNLSDYRVENRLIVIVDLHEESGESKSMENACAFLLTSHYVREEGEKPVYLYQPMSDVTDVEDKMAVFLETGSVLTPKNLWYTGLSRIEKYPLMQALDKKALTVERLDIDASLGAKSAGYRWLALAFAADAVKYAQGEQLAAYSDKNKFCITSLSSMKTAIPKKLTWCNWSNPLYPAGMAALFCVLSLIAYRISFLAQNDPPAIWELIASIIIPFVIFIGLGIFVFISKTNEAYEDMEYEWKR
ncbi:MULTISPECIES: type VI secretion system Vgr family protein [Enterobacter]|uniref:type VI secretion system Vgr family protein n=1 Tax=Enterobacter TaxID=547 RepID=UPI001E4E86C9|nr:MULTISPECIES: phage late control D family protein [Enterobacter]MCM7121834.1 phage late control D family protein [Enterobacter hormaechei]